MHPQGSLNVSETAAVGDLRPKHNQKMIPATIALDIRVAVVFLDEIFEIVTGGRSETS